MSNQINTQLLERAADMVDYFTDKLPAKVIEADIKRNDLDMLSVHVAEAEAQAAQQEMYGAEIV